MAYFKDTRGSLQRLEEELRAAETDDEEYNEPEDTFDFANDYEDVSDEDGVFVTVEEERARRREKFGMVFMGLLSLLITAALIGWWLKCRV